MQKKSVLIIEDEVELNEILMGEFHDLNYNVYSAHNLKDARQILGLHHVDVILSDINMPGEVGTEIMKHVNNFKNPVAPVIFMTGASITEVEIKQIGGSGLIRKPFSLDSITQMVMDVIQ